MPSLCSVCNASGAITGGSLRSGCLRESNDKVRITVKQPHLGAVLLLNPYCASAKVFLLTVMEEEVFPMLNTFKGEMAEMTVSMNFLSDRVDTANNLMGELRGDLSALKKEYKSLRGNVANTLLMCEKQDRISGVLTPQEDIVSIVKDVGAAICVQERTPSLVVGFCTKTLKNTWISKFKENKSLFTADEHRSPDNKLFLSRIKRKRSQELGIAFVWCRESKFFARRVSGERCYRIYKVTD
ncbi:hypothetical protein J6590_050059 [Homalodisca vitripennis]|nr:hypothetical protein J6590_050059 [Homalodisca vitripennis]